MTHEEVRSNAAGLAALPPDDPERRAAEEHARACEACRKELSEARRVIALLERVPAPEPPAPEVLARIRAQIMPPARSRIATPVLPFAVAAAFTLVVSITHTQHGDEESWVQAIVVAAAAALFGITAALRGRLAMAVAAAGSLVFALTAAIGSGAADATIGGHCMATELLASALPLAVTVALVASKRASGGPALFGAAAGVGALAGQAALHLACPVRTQSHLLIFHTGGVIVAMLVGLALSRIPVLARP